MKDKEIAIKLQNVKKRYKLGQIGGGTLQGDLQSWWARVRGQEDPNMRIDQNQRIIGSIFMALNGIDLTIYKGEAIGIIGSNGAGKSTMLKLLSRVTAPTEGEIDIYGRITSMLEVGTGFNGEMTGRENVYMNGAILGMTKAEIDAKMDEIIAFSEVGDFIDTPVKRYSSGMYVKLAFSVAAHLDSEIMIMDEVLAVGDMAFQKKCLTKMKSAANQNGKTVLYVSHNMSTIRELCDRCIVLDKGKVIYDGDVEEAISLYMGVQTELRSRYDYQDVDHRDFRTNGRFLINHLVLTNKEKPSCFAGEKLEFDITCSAKKDIENIGFRFQFQYQDGTMAGTMLSNQFVQITANTERVFHVEMNTDHLTPGRYKIDMVAYSYNGLNNEDFLDGVYPGLFIEIDEKLDNTSPLTWLHRYWGSIHLENVNLS